MTVPELPEVETIINCLRPHVKDKEIVDANVKEGSVINSGSKQSFIKKLKGRKIHNVERRGKYVVFHLGERYLVVHLRMTGSLLYIDPEETAASEKYVTLSLQFKDKSQLLLTSIRKFTQAYLVEDLDEAGSLTKLGPEPLAEDFGIEDFKGLLNDRTARIKPLLLNQRFIAGIGNIYANESLFLAGIHPLRTADSLNEDEMEELYLAIDQVLQEGIEHRGTTQDTFRDAEGEEGSHQHHLRVYDREGEMCNRCNTSIKRTKISGRSSYFCPRCQPKEQSWEVWSLEKSG